MEHVVFNRPSLLAALAVVALAMPSCSTPTATSVGAYATSHRDAHFKTLEMPITSANRVAGTAMMVPVVALGILGGLCY